MAGAPLDGDEAALRARVQRLEDGNAIIELLSAYAFALDHHHLDRKLKERWVDCFVADAVWDIRGGPRRGRHEGHGALRAFIEDHRNDPPVYQHHVTCPQVTVDGDGGRARSYLLRVEDGPTTGPRLDAFGIYHDQVVRCPDGRWRFRIRTIEVTSA